MGALTLQRPSEWVDVIGQGKAVKLLLAMLSNRRLLTPGVILAGPWGVGKTTSARLFARALLCVGNDSAGCGKCQSCLAFSGTHPDLYESDAALHSGVDAARSIVEQALQPPVSGAARATIIDEAHRMSREAWDVFLKPLESAPPGTFIFVTSEVWQIPATIMSRCPCVRFGPVETKSLAGFLTVVADHNGLRADADAVLEIAERSRGRVRDAVRDLGTAAMLSGGCISRANLPPSDDVESDAVAACLAGRPTTAMSRLQSTAKRAHMIVEAMFAAFARMLINPRTETERHVSVSFRDSSSSITDVFLRWSAAKNLPFDALPMMLHELAMASCGAINEPSFKETKEESQPTVPLSSPLGSECLVDENYIAGAPTDVSIAGSTPQSSAVSIEKQRNDPNDLVSFLDL